MRRLACSCGCTVYFDNRTCSHCGRRFAFDPDTRRMQAFEADEDAATFCANRDSASRCNWRAMPQGGMCLSCATSEIIPSLTKPGNADRWLKLERAKRRLMYDLLRLGLPIDPSRLRFVFKEDRRTNPAVLEEHVAIGHAEGVITINAAEADDVYRAKMRVQMNEPYRTLLGHFRHESGHYYFDEMIGPDELQATRAVFGDESEPYDAALERYYQNGPLLNWHENYISAYASAHPAEDWAEHWAHYLHIRAVLETASAYELTSGVEPDNWQGKFIDVVIATNEVLRSMGLPDAYPFVITATIAEKIEYIHATVERFTNRPA